MRSLSTALLASLHYALTDDSHDQKSPVKRAVSQNLPAAFLYHYGIHGRSIAAERYDWSKIWFYDFFKASKNLLYSLFRFFYQLLLYCFTCIFNMVYVKLSKIASVAKLLIFFISVWDLLKLIDLS